MQRDRLKSLLVPAAILFAGAGLRLWFILRHAVIQNDSSMYAEIARNWAQFGTYGLSTGALPRPTMIRLPGYPMFLLATSLLSGHGSNLDSFVPSLATQLMLDLITCVLLAITARRIAARAFGEVAGRRTLLATLLCGCLCPFTSNYVATPLTEVTVILTVALAIFALERWNEYAERGNPWKWGYLALTAAATGFSVLLRPDQVVLMGAVALAMIYCIAQAKQPVPLAEPVILDNALENRLARRFRAMPRRMPRPDRRYLGPAILVLLLGLLPLAPWTFRNWQTFHQFQPLAPRSAADPGDKVPTGFQRWHRTWAVEFTSTMEFYWKYPDEPIDVSLLPDRAFDSDEQYDRTSRLIDDSNDLPHYHAEIDARFQQLAQERISADPLRYYVELPFARLVNMLFRPRTEIIPYDLRWWRYSLHPQQTLYSAALALLNLAYFVVGVLGFRVLARSTPRLAVLCAAYFILRCLVLLTLDNSEQRYTIEFFPILILCAGMFVASLNVGGLNAAYQIRSKLTEEA